MANLPETPQWEDGIYQIEVSDPVLGGPDGISNRQAKQLASRTSYLKQQVEKGGSDLAKHIAAADPHTQYATKASPTFTGTPTAPTPAANDNSKKLVTTEFVARAIAALAGTVPETLDTLKELADALGNDPNFATTVLNKLAEKLAKDQNGADIPDKAAFLQNLGLGEGSALPVGVPVPWPSATPPTGWMKCNGSTFNLTSFPELAAVFPSGKLPDLRGEFIRGWDDGRGIDAGREILSAQGDAIRNITGTFGDGETAVNASISFYSADGVFATQKKIRNTIGNTTIIADTPNNPYLINFDASRVVPTASENRPRNIAFNYIVRAA
ncbi:phage tail protein [Escherichia coli]|uniref:phage tail protein n=3 Tax=Enterobacterales TaxID=91347 RepID=UPI001B1B09E3|nr:phage tail protein [Escherichia coli]EHI0550977.1 phage tail protein [Escherichia coli]EJF6055609.1 tail fiber protein [Escherichia coli]MCF3321405.1 tail fiber protein [Escherichia coli]HBA4181914.1 phage tail protein [Escherichia coli]